MAELLHDRLRYDVADGVARLTLARPDAGNALDMAMARAVGKAADAVASGAAAGEVRVAVLSAEGSMFCVGGDLQEFAVADARDAQVTSVADELHRAILVLRGCEAPVVSVVHGTVAGGGIGIALAADIVLMAEEAKLRLAYTAAGLSPDCGSTWVLPHRLGLARTMDLALTNRVLTGREAADWGLVSRAVPSDDLAAVTEQVVTGLRKGSAPALAQTKRLISSARDRDLRGQLAAESAAIAGLIIGPDGMEGIDAFRSKRRPAFR